MKIKPGYTLLALILVFAAIEAKGLAHYDNVDENVYFYMGSLISGGKMPYSDFFFAHPPLKIFVNAAIISLFGFNLLLLKAVPLASTIISAVFIYKIAKKRLGAVEALIAAALFLFSYRVMVESTYSLGMNLTTVFVVAGTYCWLSNKQLLGGMLFGLASITGLYSIVPFAVVAVLALVRDRKEFARLAAGFLIIFLATNLYFLSAAGEKYITSVYTYHLIKPEAAGNTASLFLQLIKQNWLLLGSAMLSVLFLSRKIAAPLAISGAYILFLSQLSRVFNFYLVLLLPFLAILGGYSLARLGRMLPYKKALAALLIIVIIASAAQTTKHLWTFDFADFESAKPMAEFVKQNSAQSDEIFGDMTAAPLVALFSDRRIAFDMVDTNDMLFSSGMISLAEITGRIEHDKTKFVIINEDYGIGGFNEFAGFLQEKCVYAQGFSDRYWGRFAIYDCSQV